MVAADATRMVLAQMSPGMTSNTEVGLWHVNVPMPA